MGLAAFSLAVMTGLIGRRYMLAHAARRHAARVTALKPLLFRLLDTPERIGDELARLPPDDRVIMADLVKQLMYGLRGDTRDHLVRVIKSAGTLADDLTILVAGTAPERIKAAGDMVLYGDRSVAPALRAALDDTSPDVRLAAANALAEIGAAPSIPDVVAKIWRRGITQPRVMRDLFRRLAPNNIPALLDLIGDPDSRLAAFAVDAIGVGRDLSVVPTLIERAARHPNTDVRAECQRALANLAHPAALSAVQQGLSDPTWEVRAQAASAAGRIGLKTLVPDLVRLLEDEQWWPCFRAAEALFKLGDEGQAPLYRKATDETGRIGRIVELVIMEKTG